MMCVTIVLLFPNYIIIFLKANTTEIYNDIATSDYWKVTEGEKKPKNDDEITENPTGSESNNPKLDIFSVDTYPPKDSNPAIIVLKEDINARTEIDLETKS